MVYAALGENEKAIEELLKEEVKNPFSFTFTFLPHYHVYKNLLEDPSVVKMLGRMK